MARRIFRARHIFYFNSFWREGDGGKLDFEHATCHDGDGGWWMVEWPPRLTRPL
jgi:hypothetical protein